MTPSNYQRDSESLPSFRLFRLECAHLKIPFLSHRGLTHSIVGAVMAGLGYAAVGVFLVARGILGPPSPVGYVLGGFSLFSPLEQHLVERVADTWPTVVLLPQLADSDDAVGVGRGAERALQAYHRLDFDRQYVPADTTADRVVTARRLYRPADTGTAPVGTTGPDYRGRHPRMGLPGADHGAPRGRQLAAVRSAAWE